MHHYKRKFEAKPQLKGTAAAFLKMSDQAGAPWHWACSCVKILMANELTEIAIFRRLFICLIVILSFSKTITSRLGAEDATPAWEAPPGIDYHILPRDSLQIRVYEDPDTLTLTRVTESGDISVPLIGSFKVIGKTLHEAETEVTKAYVARHLYVNPQVQISVAAYGQRSVSVLGQVNKPGTVDFWMERPSMGIAEVIALAGGFTRIARADQVKVIRNEGGKEKVTTIDVNAYLKSQTGVEQFKLLPGDVVFVDEKAF
jgi:polysaccharide export outer membrane protein